MANSPPDKLKALIAEIRKRRNLSQRQFAQRIKIAHSSVSRWESGAGTIGREGKRVIADQINCSIPELDEFLESGDRLDLESFLEQHSRSSSCHRILGLLPELSVEELLLVINSSSNQALERQAELVDDLPKLPTGLDGDKPEENPEESPEGSPGENRSESTPVTIGGLSLSEAFEILKGFVNCLIESGHHNGFSLAEIAEILDRPDDTGLIRVVETVRSGKGNGAGAHKGS